MNLSDTDVKRFYNIWFNLLDYTNEKYKVAPNIKNLAQSQNINPQDTLPIRNKLWNHNEILNEIYINNPFGFSSTDLAVVKSWTNRVSDKFILMKHLKKYSVMMGKKIYGIIGLVSPLNEMFPEYILPTFVETVLIPFEGKIIYDGLTNGYNIRFGSGSKRGFNEEYRNLKTKYGIITSM
jgi:hypothetical protein